MPTWIGLIRGINVGGRNVLRMAELRGNLDELGFRNVGTYIQSGNVCFDAAQRSAKVLSQSIGKQIARHHGFRPEVLVISAAQLAEAATKNAFPEAACQPTTLHVFFLEDCPPLPNLSMLESLKGADERYALSGRLFFLHAPAGIGRSRLAAAVERSLGVAATSRNFRTILQLLRLAGKSAD